ncbi:ATP-binding protein [Methylocystis sp. WRRC1]|uniref:ATP-binding protein n=1 Tax=Methylocystis sp. WRRC1 TaxID=1732014 RepID=UPI001D156C0A|nr:ATP-binding protein [Methylocystis sp. WRRC1]MCC3246453.1 ATP-binding protein [Methylocystis sp. WRRC1]
MSEIVNLEIVVPNQTRYLRLVGSIAEQVAKQLEVANCDRDDLAYHLNLVLTEAMVNAIQYGVDKGGKDTVRISLSVENKDLWVRVYDHGQGFDLSAVPTTAVDHLDERGRGIFFIRSLMDSVEYHKTDSGNVLEMRKCLA